MSVQTELPSAAMASRPRRGPMHLFRTYTFGFALALTIVLFVVNLILQPNFNVTAQLASFAPLAIAALASTPAIVSGRGGIDLSISPLMTFSAIIYAGALAPNGLGGGIAVPIILIIGAGIGAINGLLIVGLRLQPVVVTVSMFFIISGLNIKFAPQPIPVQSDSWIKVFAGSWGFVPGGLLIIAVPVIIWVLLKRTSYGRTLYLVGGNDAAAFSAGINVNATRVIAFSLGGMFAAIGGLSLVGLVGQAVAGTTTAYTLIGIAAVALGGTSLMGGRGGILGALLGAAVIALVQNLLSALQLSQTWLQVVYGIMLLIAVVVGAQLSAAPKGKK